MIRQLERHASEASFCRVALNAQIKGVLALIYNVKISQIQKVLRIVNPANFYMSLKYSDTFTYMSTYFKE